MLCEAPRQEWERARSRFVGRSSDRGHTRAVARTQPFAYIIPLR